MLHEKRHSENFDKLNRGFVQILKEYEKSILILHNYWIFFNNFHLLKFSIMDTKFHKINKLRNVKFSFFRIWSLDEFLKPPQG
jgi:hypothetical protein